MGESDPIDRPDPGPVAADGVGQGVPLPPGRPALTADVAPTPTACGGALPSEQLQRLADRAAAVLALPVPAVDHEPALSAEALARVLDAIEASTAASTKQAYRSDWQRFAAWAGRRRFPPLPAPPAVLAQYITEAAAEQTGIGKWRYAPATLTRWVASINQVHTAAWPGRPRPLRGGPPRPVRDPPDPGDTAEPAGAAAAGGHPHADASIGQTAGEWPAGVAARRDMALLLTGFAGAHRRSELVSLTLADVTLHSTDGLHVRLRRSKTDQEARGTVKALPYGRDPATCPPCAYVRWRQVLQAWDTAADGAARRAVLPVLRRQALTAAGGGGEEQD